MCGRICIATSQGKISLALSGTCSRARNKTWQVCTIHAYIHAILYFQTHMHCTDDPGKYFPCPENCYVQNVHCVSFSIYFHLFPFISVYFSLYSGPLPAFRVGILPPPHSKGASKNGIKNWRSKLCTRHPAQQNLQCTIADTFSLA